MKINLSLFTLVCCPLLLTASADDLTEKFKLPPDSARPGVYWYFMDGNQDREEMVADLHAMDTAGIGQVLFLEVNLDLPPGPVAFMTEKWQDNLVHAIKTCDELGMEFILGTGPGWAGSGGSWVTPEDSMQHLVSSTTTVQGPVTFNKPLPVPAHTNPIVLPGCPGPIRISAISGSRM